MSKLKATIYKKNIYEINYNKLKEKNIKCLLFDLDNTCATIEEKEPSKELIKLFTKLKKMNFDIYIFSNALAKRVEKIKKKLNVNSIPFALKPFKRNYKKIVDIYKKEEIVMIGDQIFTDVLGANRLGITTILVEPINNKDLFLTKINRLLEKLVRKGDYYE